MLNQEKAGYKQKQLRNSRLSIRFTGVLLFIDPGLETREAALLYLLTA